MELVMLNYEIENGKDSVVCEAGMFENQQQICQL